jgi:hypothetical protein
MGRMSAIPMFALCVAAVIFGQSPQSYPHCTAGTSGVPVPLNHIGSAVKFFLDKGCTVRGTIREGKEGV